MGRPDENVGASVSRKALVSRNPKSAGVLNSLMVSSCLAVWKRSSVMLEARFPNSLEEPATTEI